MKQDSSSIKEEKEKQRERESSFISNELSSESPHKSSKRQTLHLKKLNKKPEISRTQEKNPNNSVHSNSFNNHPMLLTPKIQLNSIKGEAIEMRLYRILQKPGYVSVDNSIIKGSLGHSTTSLKRPILEGHFFVEFKVREVEIPIQKNLKYPPSVRIGVCPINFNHAYPLARQDSFCYRCFDGMIWSGGEQISTIECCKEGDIVGLCLDMSPPFKYQNSQELSKDSSLKIFKNGKQIYEFRGIKQNFYCFAVSLFNYSEIELILDKKGIFAEIYGINKPIKHYFECICQKINYKDLQKSKIFRIT